MHCGELCSVAAGSDGGDGPDRGAGPASRLHPARGPLAADNFWLTTPAGDLYAFGVPSYGVPGWRSPQQAHRRHGSHPRPAGYWMVASDGGIFSYGNAHFYGSTGNIVLNRPIVGMAATHDQGGYWMVASDGGVFSFGDAAFYGSTGNIVLNKPIVGMAADPRREGLLAGGLGRRASSPSATPPSTVRPGTSPSTSPSWAWTPRPTGGATGWWPSDGGVFSFGDAAFYGSTAGQPGDPVERLVTTASGHGYWIVQQNGTATPFGDAGPGSTPMALLFSPVTPGDPPCCSPSSSSASPTSGVATARWATTAPGLALASWTHGAGIGFARVADDQYHTAGAPVPMNGLQAGDLVFWGYTTTRLDQRLPHRHLRGRQAGSWRPPATRPAQRAGPVGHRRT